MQKKIPVNLLTYWSGVHIRQFYLDVSDVQAKQSTTDQRTHCYTDTTTDTVGPRSIKKIRDIQCYYTARYVIVESHYISPENDPSEGAVLEICEIEVFGRYTCSLKTPINLIKKNIKTIKQPTKQCSILIMVFK